MNQFDKLEVAKRFSPTITYINDLDDIELLVEERAKATRTQSITNAFLTELEGISIGQNLGPIK